MELEHLVKMANQIEAFFRAEPDPNVAIDGIGTHIKRFWDPRMRKQIITHAEGGGDGLRDLVKAAIAKHLIPAKPVN